jgi:hypothetical protein
MHLEFTRPFRALLVVALTAGVVLGATVGGDEAWAGNKPKLKAKINDKTFKSNLRAGTLAHFNPTGDIVIINGFFQKITLARGTIKTFDLILNIDLETAVLPVTVPVTDAIFTDNTFTGPVPPATIKAWGGPGVNVTIDSYDGTMIKGTFEGVIPPSVATPLPPATVEKGKFKLPVMNAGS